ncbi:MAG: hypothetical protein WC326_05625 [Candidatus Delongbacteria bacterium]
MGKRKWLALLLLALISSGCMLSTVNHLWATRRQLLKFDEFVRYEKAGPVQGPGIRLLQPRLTTEDIRALANGRPPSRILKDATGETWIFRWQRRPPQRGKTVTLELRFQSDLLVGLHVDKRFADKLGDARIEMLIRQFVGPATDLDVFHKRVVSHVPARENARFPALTLADIRELFGPENLIRELPLKRDEPSHIYRYQLDGAQGDKAAMSFGVRFQENRQLAMITSRLGSFSLVFDFSGR